MPSTLELREQYGEIYERMKTLQETAETEQRSFTAAEAEDFESFEKQLEDLDKRIAESERIALRADKYASREAMEREDRTLFPGEASGSRFRDSDGRELRAFQYGERISDSLNSFAGTRQTRPVSVGEHVYGMLTGRMSDEARAQLGGSSVQGGYLLSPSVSANIVDLARSASVAMRAGAQTLPISGTTRIARVSSDPTPQWRGESQQITASDITFDSVELRPKTIATLVPISVELAEDAVGVMAQIESVISSAMGQALDQAILTGAGSANEPLGIRNDPNVGSQAAVGTPSDYTDLSTAITTIQTANFSGPLSGLSWIVHPRDLNTYDDLVDSTGQPLMPTPMTRELQRFTTTSLPTTEGGGSDESVMLVGDFSEVVVGMRTNVTVQLFDSGQATDGAGDSWNALDQLMRWVRVYMRLDVAILRPTWHVVLSGVLA